MRDRSVWAVLGVFAVVAIAALLMSGGQVSGILSTVGRSIDTPHEVVGVPPDEGAEAPGDEAGASTNEAPDAAALVDGARVVRTGSLELVVESTDAAAVTATDLVVGAGGYVGESHVAAGDRPTARIAYRIPADRWDATLEALRGIGDVVGEETKSADITNQLVDLEARIANLRAGEQALQGIAAGAVDIDDVLKVQSRLAEVRGEIEQLDAQRARLDDQAAYGTLQVTLGIEVVAVVEAAEEWDAAVEVDRATATLVDILQGLASAGIWVGIVWLPVLLGLATVAGVAAFTVRRVRRLVPG